MVESQPLLRKHLVQRLGLRRGAGEAVEDEPPGRVGLGDPRRQHGRDDRVGDEAAALHDGPRLEPDGRARLDLGAQHVSG